MITREKRRDKQGRLFFRRKVQGRVLEALRAVFTQVPIAAEFPVVLGGGCKRSVSLPKSSDNFSEFPSAHIHFATFAQRGSLLDLQYAFEEPLGERGSREIRADLAR